MNLDNNMFLIIAVIVLVYWLMNSGMLEGFDADTVEFVPVGANRYGLRGDLLRRESIAKIYLNPDRQIRLNPSSGWMYPSNKTPAQEAVPFCRKMQCPTNTNGYDHMDTCWVCDTADYAPQKIPPIHPHVPN